MIYAKRVYNICGQDLPRPADAYPVSLTWGDADEAADRWLDSRTGGCYFVFSSWSCYALLAMATIATTVDAIEIWKAKIHCYTYIFKIGRLHCTPFVFLRFFPSKKKTCSWLVHLDLHCFFRQLDTQFATVKTILFWNMTPTNLYFGLASIFMHSGILLDPISQNLQNDTDYNYNFRTLRTWQGGMKRFIYSFCIISLTYTHQIDHHWHVPYTSSTPSMYLSGSSRHMYQVIMPNVCPTQVPSESFGRIGRVDAWWCHDLHERDPA